MGAKKLKVPNKTYKLSFLCVFAALRETYTCERNNYYDASPCAGDRSEN